MTTNREWLYGLDVADLADWFDAEHVDDSEELQNHRELLDRALFGWQEALKQRDELVDELATCKHEREQYRELFSKAITQAAEIVNLQP